MKTEAYKEPVRAEELRIGNWLYGRDSGKIEKSFFQVESISEDGINLYQVHGFEDEYASYVEPIELTEQWLLKAGFKDLNDKYPAYEIFLHRALHNDVYLRCNKKLCRWFVVEKEAETDRQFAGTEIIFNIKYLHQLQNLFFAITGSELDFKEELP